MSVGGSQWSEGTYWSASGLYLWEQSWKNMHNLTCCLLGSRTKGGGGGVMYSRSKDFIKVTASDEKNPLHIFIAVVYESLHKILLKKIQIRIRGNNPGSRKTLIKTEKFD